MKIYGKHVPVSVKCLLSVWYHIYRFKCIDSYISTFLPPPGCHLLEHLLCSTTRTHLSSPTSCSSTADSLTRPLYLCARRLPLSTCLLWLSVVHPPHMLAPLHQHRESGWPPPRCPFRLSKRGIMRRAQPTTRTRAPQETGGCLHAAPLSMLHQPPLSASARHQSPRQSAHSSLQALQNAAAPLVLIIITVTTQLVPPSCSWQSSTSHTTTHHANPSHMPSPPTKHPLDGTQSLSWAPPPPHIAATQRPSLLLHEKYGTRQPLRALFFVQAGEPFSDTSSQSQQALSPFHQF